MSFLQSAKPCDPSVSLLLMVSSGPANKIQRDRWRRDVEEYRESESNRKNNKNIKLVFIIAKARSDSDTAMLESENAAHEDIVQSDTEDGHRRLGYKLLMGYVWAYTYCGEVDYVAKTDDNVELDMETVMDALEHRIGPEENFITCPTLNWGMKVLRSATPHMTGNWSVSKEVFDRDVMPDFCIGFLYVTTPQVGAALTQVGLALYSETEVTQIEDSLITGVLRERLPQVTIQMLETPGVPSLWQIFFTVCPWMNTFKQTFFNNMIRSKRSSRNNVHYVGPVTTPGVWRFFICLHLEGLFELVDLSAPGLVPSWMWDLCVR